MFILKFPVKRLHLPYVSSHYIRPRLTLTAGAFCRFKTSYIVLLPEVPDDTAENNPLLTDSEFPNFNELTAEKCYTGVGKRCLDYESGVWQVEKNIKDGSQSNTFSNIIDELDKLDAPLAFTWNIVKTLCCVKNEVVPTSTYLKIHERARKARVYKFQSQPIYEACKEIYVKDSTLNEAQKRVIRKYLLEARLNGVELSHKGRGSLAETIKKLDEHKTLYRKKLEESSKRFSYRIIHHEIVQDFPEDLLKKMSYSSTDYLKGPWTVTHRPSVYHKFLEHCPDKDLRWNAWRAYVSRSSMALAHELNNSIHIEQIRDARQQQAKILGFKTFADMSMETKMAGSVDNVLTMITSFFAKAKEKQLKEICSLKEFAKSRGFKGELEECDVPYWRRKERVHILKSKEMEIEKYFPFNHVWEQLLFLCSNLFGIHFEEVPSDQVQTWHSDVQFYNILDSDGKRISSFYLDPYKRPNEKLQTESFSAWMLTMKTRCDVANASPLASLIFNFQHPLPEKNNAALLSLAEVQILFKEFGHILQHLLSTVPYGQVSGLANIEWDAVEVCSNFLLNWLYEPSVLQKISKHYESGLPLDESGISSILAGRSHMAAYDLCNELFLAHLDIKLHTDDTYWLDILKELWPIYMPFELSKHNYLPCWFSPIMSDVWAAAYFSHLWSKMLAADVFRAFKECEPQNVTVIGKRFRETFLSMGGGCHPAEVFRNFRGRDPMPEALHTTINS